MNQESKSTQDSQSNKSDKVLVYDLSSVPRDAGVTLERVLEIYQQEGLLIWDSANGGKEPSIIDASEVEGIQMYDVSKDEDLKEFERVLMEEGHPGFKEDTLYPGLTQEQLEVRLDEVFNEANMTTSATTPQRLDILSVQDGIVVEHHVDGTIIHRDPEGNIVGAEITSTGGALSFGEEFQEGSSLSNSQGITFDTQGSERTDFDNNPSLREQSVSPDDTTPPTREVTGTMSTYSGNEPGFELIDDTE